MRSDVELGAFLVGPGKCRFKVWAPYAKVVEVHVVAPSEKFLALEKGADGYFSATFENLPAGTLYYYRMDGKDKRPDPISHFQPEGVFGPSEVIDQNFAWTDQNWRGLPLRDYVLYELHVGTFSSEGTYDGIIPQLDSLKALGVTAIELMPLAQFSGGRNWGYDGVLPYAPQNTYGRPNGLKNFINVCHAKGLAVVLDVVYNHLGPEGNYLNEYGPYFTGRYKTPWGSALNYDDVQSDEVKRYFIENAVYWIKNYHFDGLRLDAVQTIMDVSAKHFLQILAEEVKKEAKRENRQVFLMGECDLNDEKFVLPKDLGGLGLDSQWDDDFHHALHSFVTGERGGYYRDYGTLKQLAKSFAEGFVYTGEYSEFRQKSHGKDADRVPAEGFVVFGQNHDQIGNRCFGDRLNTLIGLEPYKLTAGAFLLSPFVPLLFMGEEYAEPAPFQYFVSHRDPDLIRAVRNGRREEFKAFGWKDEVPLPDSEDTYLRCKLNHNLKSQSPHREVHAFYQQVLGLRKAAVARKLLEREHLKVNANHDALTLELNYTSKTDSFVVAFNFSSAEQTLALTANAKNLKLALSSSSPEWLGSLATAPERLNDDRKVELAPTSFAIYQSFDHS